jgi:dethiobiotin synthetase
MAKRIFITATNTNVGKTYATALLLKEFAARGLRVGVFKPIETGVESIPKDGKKLFDLAKELNPLLRCLSLKSIVPYQFRLPAAPYVAKENHTINIDFLLHKLKAIEEHCDLVLIEGAGGLMVPIEEDLFMVDLIAAFDASVLLVCPSRLGGINDTLLSRYLLESKKIAYTWAINLYEDSESFEKVSAPFYKNDFLSLQNDIKTIANKL